jgi:Nif-specific regulatory protein
MSELRSVLWIGRAEALEIEGVSEAPHLDLAWARDVDEALSLPLEAFDAVVLDAPDGSALEDARRLARRGGGTQLLVRLAEADDALVRALLEAGASDVVVATRPGAGADRLASRLGLVARRSPARRARSHEVRVESHDSGGGSGATLVPGDAEPGPLGPTLLGRSPAMQQVFALVARAQRSRATVLLQGETGTGKELLAQAIHEGSARRRRPFVALNCAAFPDTLLESELFGHVRGAFTGADRDRRGLFEVADGGTLFLDEVGETSGPLQAKLLRALQEREIRPVGGTRSRHVDVRVIAATNRDLRFEIASARFRADLFWRLAVFPIAVPPLRQRPQDVLPLAEHFLRLHGEREGKAGCHFAREATHLLLSYSWPGNVRELENEVQRALALAEAGEMLGPGLLSERLEGIAEPVEGGVREGETLRETLGRIESLLLRRALERNGGRRAETARRLGLTREGLYK